jgi:hypothetical protein
MHALTGKPTVPIIWAGWAPEPVWTCKELTPDAPVVLLLNRVDSGKKVQNVKVKKVKWSLCLFN